MQTDDIERMLKTDFDEHVRQLENDRFAERMLHKFAVMKRRRHGVIIGAGVLGSLIAASQFMTVVQSVTPALSDNANSPAYQILMVLVLGSALAASALVLRQEV